MKIAIVIKHYSLRKGGGERYAVKLCEALAEKGHEVEILATSFDTRPPLTSNAVHIRVRKKPSWWRNLFFAIRVKKYLQKTHHDVTYALTEVYPVDLYRAGGGVYKIWLKTKYRHKINRIGNIFMNPVHIVNLYLEKKIIKNGNATCIIANSNLCREQIIQTYRVSDQKVHLVHNGVNHVEFNMKHKKEVKEQMRKTLKVKRNNLVLSFVSNNWKRKGLHILIKALYKLNQDGNEYHLLVAGRGNESYFRRLAAKEGLRNKVHFVGFRKDISLIYKSSDFFVLPTLYDPFSNSCLEAMACGVPVITSLSNGAAEIIHHGINGYVLKDPENVKELSELISLGEDKETLKQMSLEAYKTSLKYTFKFNVKKTLDLFNLVIARKR